MSRFIILDRSLFKRSLSILQSNKNDTLFVEACLLRPSLDCFSEEKIEGL